MMKTESTNSQPTIFRDASLLFLSRVIGFFFLLAMQMILVRALPTVEYAEFRKIILFSMTTTAIGFFGIHNSVLHYLKSPDHTRNAVIIGSFTIFCTLASLAFLIIAGFHTTIAVSLNMRYLDTHWLPIAITISGMFASGGFEKILIADARFGLAFWLILLSDAAVNIGIIVLLAFFKSVDATLWMMAFVALLRLVLLWMYCSKEWQSLATWTTKTSQATFDVIKAQLRFSLPLGCGAIIVIVGEELHKFVISEHMDAAIFAIYITGCLRIPFVNSILYAVGDVFNISLLDQLQSHDHTLLKRTWKQVIQKLSLIFAILGIYFILIADDLFLLFYTEKFSASAHVFRILTLTLFFRFSCANIVLRALNRSDIYFKVALVFFPLTIALIFAAAITENMMLVAASATTAIIATELTLFYQACRLTQTPISSLLDRRFFLKLTVFSLSSAAVIALNHVLIENTTLRFLFASLEYAALVLLFIARFGLLPADDWQRILKKIAQIRHQGRGFFRHIFSTLCALCTLCKRRFAHRSTQ